MAIRMVKSPAPALQSEICTSTLAGQPGEMAFLLRLMEQMFSSFAPQLPPPPEEVGVLVGALGVLVLVGVAVGEPGVLVRVGVLVGPATQDTYCQVTLTRPSLR
jgi:hypothetical protein